MPRDLSISRELTAQPSRTDTRKGQKKALQKKEYDALTLNSELDHIHERINQLVAEDPLLDDLVTSGVVATDVTALIARVNSIVATLKNAGLLKQS